MIYRAELPPHPCLLPLQCKDCWGPISHPVAQREERGEKGMALPFLLLRAWEAHASQQGTEEGLCKPKMLFFPFDFPGAPAPVADPGSQSFASEQNIRRLGWRCRKETHSRGSWVTILLLPPSIPGSWEAPRGCMVLIPTAWAGGGNHWVTAQTLGSADYLMHLLHQNSSPPASILLSSFEKSNGVSFFLFFFSFSWSSSENSWTFSCGKLSQMKGLMLPFWALANILGEHRKKTNLKQASQHPWTGTNKLILCCQGQTSHLVEVVCNNCTGKCSSVRKHWTLACLCNSFQVPDIAGDLELQEILWCDHAVRGIIYMITFQDHTWTLSPPPLDPCLF